MPRTRAGSLGRDFSAGSAPEAAGDSAAKNPPPSTPNLPPPQTPFSSHLAQVLLGLLEFFHVVISKLSSLGKTKASNLQEILYVKPGIFGMLSMMFGKGWRWQVMASATSTTVPSPTASFLEILVPLLLVKSCCHRPKPQVLPANPRDSLTALVPKFPIFSLTPHSEAPLAQMSSLTAALQGINLGSKCPEWICCFPVPLFSSPKSPLPRDQFATEIIHLSLQDWKSRLCFCSQSLQLQPEFLHDY